MLLAETDRYSFSKLTELFDGTDGNLGAQLRKLEDNEYVTVDKTFQGRRPASRYQLTPVGCKALKAHLKASQGLIGYTG